MASRHLSLVQRTIALLPHCKESSSLDQAKKLAFSIEELMNDRETNEAALLCSIGMAKHPNLIALRNRLVSNPIFAHLEHHFKQNVYFEPGSLEPTQADGALVWYARDVIDFVFEHSDRVIEFPSSHRWLESCLVQNKTFKSALQADLVENDVLDSDVQTRICRGGVREPGGMIDAQPKSTDARRAAERVKELNKDYKKQQSQRQKEKAKEEETKSPLEEEEKSGQMEFLLGAKISSSDPERIKKCVDMLKRVLNLTDLPVAHHAAAMDAQALDAALVSQPGIKCKNLFLKCKKKRNAGDLSGLYLVCVPTSRTVDLKFLQKQLGLSDQLRFATEELLTENLDVIQGSVTPYALVNDPKAFVNLVLDEEMMNSNGESLLWFHPLDNQASIGLSVLQFKEFVRASGRIPLILALSSSLSTITAPSIAAVTEKKMPLVTESKKSPSRGAKGNPVVLKKPAPLLSSESSIPRPGSLAEAMSSAEKALKVLNDTQKECDLVVANGDEQSLTIAMHKKRIAEGNYTNCLAFVEEWKKTKPISLTNTPLVMSLTHDLAQDRLWARLEKFSLRPKRLDITEEGLKYPKGHSTHNLMVKDTKSKQLYMICVKSDKTPSLDIFAEKLGGLSLRLAGIADVETALALTKGCITPLWLFNNVQNNVIPVFDAQLLGNLDDPLVICAGCDDANNHASHNCVSITMKQILQLISEGAKREHIVLE